VSRGRLLVVGAGLVGTSVALAARRVGWSVWVVDNDPDAQTLAVERSGASPGRPPEPPGLVVIAVPPRSAAAVIQEELRLSVNATVTDVSSVKAELQGEVELFAGAERFVPGHPLAGSEVSGARGARADLFADRVWVLTPGERTVRARVDAVDEFAASLGAVVLRWDAVAHDDAVALTSHLPQLLSSLLAARIGADAAADVRLSGQGLRDMTRIAASDVGLWSQILVANAGPVATSLAALRADLDLALTALESITAGHEAAGEAVLRDLLQRGNTGRARLPGRHGDRDAPMAAVVVTVADRPGELARLFTLAADVDVNLADVRIDHALGRPTGLVELSVAAGRRATFVASLREAGWLVQEQPTG
jgi:prephenate dehydrogenase